MANDGAAVGEDLEFVAVGGEGDLAEGEMRAAMVGGKRVLLALVEGVPYALGAVCTHERANLDEGTLDGHELYCPLHFSCFDIRTGEALEPPAEKATTVYAIKIEDGTVFVSSRPVDPDDLPVDSGAGVAPAADAPAGPQPAPTPHTEPTPEPETAAPTEPMPEPEPAAPTVPEPEPAAPTEPAPEPAAEPAPAPALTASGVRTAALQPPSWHGRALAAAEDLPGLEGAAQSFGTALRPLRESRAGGHLFDLLHGRAMGHSLHPALSDLPIGLWFGAVVLDVAGSPHGALILAIAGVAAGLAAAVSGVADWTVSDGRDRRVGLLHGILQTIAILIVSVSVVLRLVDVLLVGQLVGAAGLALSLASAYLGGHLVLGRGVMVDHTAWIRGPRGWTQAIDLAELREGQAKAVTVEGREVLVSLQDHTVAAMEAACTHAGGPLSRGLIADGVVKCPWHGSCFRLRDGAVVKGPASHPQPMLEARIRDGWVQVRGRGRW